ncbi:MULTISPECIES: ring-cleaving dioxygenase [Fictibacillus]|uniref:Ring-cleaving dioxygenase n=1 Tax=Fictibacillus enclensis TaxID=1017270 RepID=A0A0V8J8T8_9BACL|nr:MULTISPECIES: ring-cleaving dioxygenase [Fictibacillus]KSU83322.1 ring-cleaving dioxygenase [Fictibacillus enclensis]MDM5200449.1 ring-cleaving dioxygenase [Fictibacillus enclensis]RXZ02069.1 ring-cleaving dioxygenase [Fictibacillus sp. S7]SCC13548.1 glyoxalase family protein [Fictibacillus enclensis]
MEKRTSGIHHITAIVGNPQENVDFYAGVLGLRLVKKTVNFDDPGTYHLYFGNEEGSPGTIMTFFPWPGAYSGRTGAGQVGVTSFVVPENSLDFWENRLTTFNVPYEKTERYGEHYLTFDDPHGLHLELVSRSEGKNSEWSFGGVSADVAIKGFGGAVLLSGAPHKTMNLLTDVMGMEKVGEEGEYVRFRTSSDLGNIIDVKTTAQPRGMMGTGTVHHIAWRASDYEDHEQWRSHVGNNGYEVTPIIDRQYFNAVYFRESGGILFEIATDPPGFARDEPKDVMGKNLLLPPWLEPEREKIEAVLLPADARVLKEDQS